MNNDFYYEPNADVLKDDWKLRDILSVLMKSKRLVIGSTLLTFLCGVVYCILASPIYEADGLLQVEDKNSNLAQLDTNSLFEGDTSINAEIEILRSRSVLGPVVDALALDVTAEPEFFPIIGKAMDRRKNESERQVIRITSARIPDALIRQRLSLIARSGARYELLSHDGEKILAGKTGELATGQYQGQDLQLLVSELNANDGDVFGVKRQYRLPTIEKLKNALDIRERGSGSGILEVSLEGPDPKEVSRQVNAIADSYVSQNKDRKTREAEITLDFLDTQLPTVKQDMESAEVALNNYRLDKGSVDLPLETQAILETIVSVEGQRSELELERVNAIQQFTPAHPSIIAIDGQLNRLSAELRELNNSVRDLPNTQQEVLRLVRDVAVNTELYTALLNTTQELRVIRAGTVGNVRIVDAAVEPLSPVKPRKALILVLSLILGGVIGAVLTFTRRAMSGGIDDPDIIERSLGLPLYATILHSKRQKQLSKISGSDKSGTRILANTDPNDPTIEGIRNIRSALHFRSVTATSNRIMVTSPTSEVGKSFVSENLAAVLSSNGKKVLLVDGDMRNGALHRHFGTRRSGGLSEFVLGKAQLADVLRPTDVSGLSLMTTGTLPADPTELLLSSQFSTAIDALAKVFDHVVIDAPAVLDVTDPAIIGQSCGTTILVLKAAAHPIREIESSVKRLAQVGVEVSGLIVNE